MELSKKEILFLWLDNSHFFAQMSKKRGVSVEQTYKNMNKFEKIVRNIQITLNLSSVSYWLDSWKTNLDEYHTVIIHASILTPAVVKYIRNINSSIRIIVWYWNPVDKSVNLSKFKEFDCEIWVFDENDASKYSLNHNTQYYFKKIKLPKSKNYYDISFIGGDKGRIEILDELNKKISNLNLSTYFHVTETKGIEEKYKGYYKPRIDYKDILKIISQSNAILDIVSEGQTGLTLRPLEALFFKKKLITNDISIAKRDFYNKNNIFILGKDNLQSITTFLNQPYENIDMSIVHKYDFDSWIERFF